MCEKPSKMIVIVEDDEVAGRLLVKMIVEFFPNEKYIWLKSIAETNSFFSKNKLSTTDLLLLDFYLPDGTVWDIMEKIKSNELNFSGRIVLIPGIQPNNEEEKLIKLYNPFSVIVKPIELFDLNKLLE